MHKIMSIKISGVRRLQEVAVEMRPLTVMIGANGVGKTSMLDALSLLAASASGTLNKTLNDLGGVTNLCTHGWMGGMTFEAKMNDPGASPLEYELHLSTQGQTYQIDRERLTQRLAGHGQPFKHLETVNNFVQYYDTGKKALVRPDWTYDPKESALAQVPKMFKVAEDFRRVIGSATQYHVLEVGHRSPIRLPQQMRPVTLPGTNGEDLVSFLYYLRESDRERYEVIEDSMKAAFPGFETMNFPPVAAGMLSLTWKERPWKNPFHIHQLSEGTLRFLWLVSLLKSPDLSTITMIDEPEVSLHPELLNLLADTMREAARETQVIVATHSDRLIRFMKPHEVLVLDMDEEGYAKAIWGDAMDLEGWLEEYSLDEVWRMGRMGGRA
ncbi:MAG: AAA family ATPase [Magnetococcales bacterium]|nr:AAA family ATPase [Magnetococcales bacterium]MBF0150977.1 AAA family ATPase [Magnetococcales bacterium]